MRIDGIELVHVALPPRSVDLGSTAAGSQARPRETVLVGLRSGDLLGWAETCPGAAPFDSPEWAGGVYVALRDWLAPAVLGQWIGSGEELQERLAPFRGNPFAKAGIDIAWWVLKAAQQQKPLAQLLDGTRSEVELVAQPNVRDSLDDLMTAIGSAFDEGYQEVKLSFQPGWDIHMLRSVRSLYQTQAFRIDCHAAFSFDRHYEMFCRLDDFMLTAIEQPLGYDDLLQHAQLQTTISTPIALDESITSLAQAEQAVQLGSCRGMSLKPARVGGLTTALAIAEVCQEAGIPCWVDDMSETPLGMAAALALATREEFVGPAHLPIAIDAANQDASETELAAATWQRSRSAAGVPTMVPSNQPGLGVEPDPERLARWTKAHHRLGPS